MRSEEDEERRGPGAVNNRKELATVRERPRPDKGVRSWDL